MSQSLSDASSSFAGLAPSRRTARFGVALIAVLLTACFAVLIAARADHASIPTPAAAASVTP